MIFDIKTLMVVYIMISLISAAPVLIIWSQNRKRYGGLTHWTIAMFFQTFGVFLIVLRGVIPDFLSIILANLLLVSGNAILVIGLELFSEKKISKNFKYILLLISFAGLIYYTVFDPDVTRREITNSIVLVVLFIQGFWTLRHKVSSEFQRNARITSGILFFYVVVSLVRILHLLLSPSQSSVVFNPDNFDSVIIILYIGLTSCLTISLILMVNQRLLQSAQAQEEKFTLAFHSSPYSILLTRLSDGVIFEANDGFVNTIGFSCEEAIGKTTTQLHLWAKQEDRADIVKLLLSDQHVQGAEFQFRKKSGELMSGLFSAKIILVNNEKCILSSISDITEISRMKEKLQAAALHDNLTGIPNRMLFYERFALAAENAKLNHKKLAVMSLDIDHFKTINDRFGHAGGDLILIETTKMLADSLREVDTIARFGGDEFIILLSEIENRDDAERVTRKIMEKFRQPIIIGQDTLTLSISIGAAIYPEDGETINVLIQKSDDALYFVKENGRCNYHFTDGQ